MELLKKLKTAEIPKPDPLSEQIQFLEDSNFNRIVNKALAELYRIQPPKPITYLIQFLLNESNSTAITDKITQDKEIKEQTLQRRQEQEAHLVKLNEEVQKKEDEHNVKIKDLETLITSTHGFKDLNEICDRLKELVGATGVYVLLYDMKRKEVKSIDEDDRAHIHPDNIKVLRYIAWNKDHEFLHRKFIQPRKGVTYSLFKAKGEDGEEDEDEGGEGDAEGGNDDEKKEDEDAEENEEDEGDKKEKEDNIKTVLIENVVSHPKIIFFREPRLGAYMALNVTFKSSLNYTSLLSAIDKLNEYNAKLEEQEKRKAEEAEQGLNGDNDNNNEEQEENENEGEDGDDGEEGEEGEKDEKVKDDEIVLEEFEKDETTLILALDTLGQDRTFSESEKTFITSIAKLLRDSLQINEQKLLEKDRDLRIEYLKLEKPLAEEWTTDKILSEQDIASREYANSEEFYNKNITDEEMKNVEMEYAKANWIIQTFTQGDFLSLLEMFEQFEFVEYERIFQNILYFAQVEPSEINFSETNALCWRMARKKWKDIFEVLRAYTPLGPKPGKILSVFKGNVILEKLLPFMEEAEMEKITEYSFVLARLLEYVVEILKVRKSDIITRHTDQRRRIKERNDIIKANEKIEKDRRKALARAKAIHAGKKVPEEGEEEEKEEKEDEKGEEDEEEGENEEEEDKEEEQQNDIEAGNEGEDGKDKEPFNEEAFLEQYDQDHPKQPVPDEVVVDLDEDFDVEEEKQGSNEENEEDEEEGDDQKDEEE